MTSGTLYDAVKTYLAASTPQTSFAATTIADYTFILNKTITVAKDSTVGAKRNPEALVYIATGDYGTTYKIRLKEGDFNLERCCHFNYRDFTTSWSNWIWGIW